VHCDLDPICLRVQADCGHGKFIDLARVDLCRARNRCRDANEPRAGGEIEHAFAAHQLRMIENVARERLTARPRERPEGRRQSDFAEVFFRLFPQRRRLVC
jgi:hypothetical protein